MRKGRKQVYRPLHCCMARQAYMHATGERHRAARENMNSNVGAWGVMFPAKGMREGDYPGEFAHMMLFTDMTALMRYQEDFTNGGGWRAREEYYKNFASCTGENVYSSRVINRPASAWAE